MAPNARPRHKQFERAKEVRAEHGGGVFANARNAAVGTIRAKNRAYAMEMTFFALALSLRTTAR